MNSDENIMKVGVVADVGKSKSRRLPEGAGDPSHHSASAKVENFRSVPVVGRFAWRTQYRLIAGLLLFGLIALGLSALALFNATTEERARQQAQVVALHSLIDVDQAFALGLSDVQGAAQRLDTALRNGNAAVSRWAAGSGSWMEMWSKVETQAKPWREALGKVPASDPRMMAAAASSRQAVAELGQALRVAQPTSSALSNARVYLILSTLWVVLSLILLLWIHSLQQKLANLNAQAENERVQQSIMTLTNHMQLVTEGDLTQKAQVYGDDSVAGLAGIVNNATGGLRDLARSVKLTSEKTINGVQLVSDTTGLLVDRAREDLSTQESNGTELLKLTQGIRRLTQLARLVNEASVGVDELVRSGSDAVGLARTRLEEIRKLNEEAGNRVGRLALSSREISSIATLLHSLADQAGVLADQAALQAARAGDSGKGFAIVAAGMGELAHQTYDNARKVGTLIETALSDIEAARSSMTDAVSGTDEASRLIDVSNDAGREAVEKTAELSSSINELGQLVSEQDQIASILGDNTQHALERIEDGRIRAQKAAEGVQDLMDHVRDLRQSADKFKV